MPLFLMKGKQRGDRGQPTPLPQTDPPTNRPVQKLEVERAGSGISIRNAEPTVFLLGLPKRSAETRKPKRSASYISPR